jgi:hypothetical protein
VDRRLGHSVVETSVGENSLNAVAIDVERDVVVRDLREKPRKRGAIDAWLDNMLRRYMGQKSAMWNGRNRLDHSFGWSSASVLGKIKDERDGAGQGSFRQAFAEFFTEDALLVRRSLEGMSYDPYIVGHLHYMVAASVSVKARDAGYAPSTYWDHLKVFHTWVERGVTLLDSDVSREVIPGQKP